MSEVKTGWRQKRWGRREQMWRKVMMTKQKKNETKQKKTQLNPPPPTVFEIVGETTKKNNEKKVFTFFFFSKMGFVLVKAHTHNMLSHKGSVVWRPFWICCYNSGQASGVVEPEWRWGVFLPVYRHAEHQVSVHRQAADGEGEESECVMKVSEGGGGRGRLRYNVWRCCRVKLYDNLTGGLLVL